jgi:hypothetical protein
VVTLSALLAISVALSATPDSLSLGKDQTARIDVRVTGFFGRSVPDARVSLSTNIGALGEPQRNADGTFTAHFTPPRSRAPSVAIIAADAEAGGEHTLGWLALPLAGTDSMTLETKPHASVHLRIADREFGPAVANARGEVQFQVVVPPGVRKATMHVEDPLGNTADQQLDLDPPPFPRMRVLPVGPPHAASGDSLEMEAFVIRPDGSPDSDADLTASAERGEIDVSRNRRGVVAVSWRPPPSGTGQSTIDVEGLGERTQLRASFAPGARQPRHASRAGFGPASAGLFASGGLTFHGVPALGGTAELAMPLAGTPFEALIDVGGVGWFATDEHAPAPFAQYTEHAEAAAFVTQLGARATRSYGGADLHVTLFLGAQQTWVSADTPGKPALTRSPSAFALCAGAAFGASWHLGPGRFLVQAHGSLVPSVGGLEHALNGIALEAGYLLPLSK